MDGLFKLRLFPLSLERSAQLAQFEAEERYAIECAQIAYDEERERVEEEWKKGRQRVRERLLEGIEERRRRAREEKEGEGTVGGLVPPYTVSFTSKISLNYLDASLDSHSRPPITRKLRNKLGTSPPPTPHSGPNINHSISMSGSNAFSFTSNNLIGSNGMSTSHLPFTIGTFSFLNPHSLSVDELPSPFPLPLTSTNINNGGGGAASGTTGNNGPSNGSRRRAKGGGGNQGQALGGLGKSLLLLNMTKDTEIESDLGEIRRGGKRRRAAVAPGTSKTS
jgi:hypothetical protein